MSGSAGRCLTSGFRPLTGPAAVTAMTPVPFRWRRSGNASWCRLGGGGSFGPGQPDSPEDDLAKTATALLDAIAGARTPVLRADCCGTSVKECSDTWAATKNATREPAESPVRWRRSRDRCRGHLFSLPLPGRFRGSPLMGDSSCGTIHNGSGAAATTSDCHGARLAFQSAGEPGRLGLLRLLGRSDDCGAHISRFRCLSRRVWVARCRRAGAAGFCWSWAGMGACRRCPARGRVQKGTMVVSRPAAGARPARVRQNSTASRDRCSAAGLAGSRA